MCVLVGNVAAGEEAAHRQRHREHRVYGGLHAQHVQPAVRQEPLHSYPFTYSKLHFSVISAL